MSTPVRGSSKIDAETDRVFGLFEDHFFDGDVPKTKVLLNNPLPTLRNIADRCAVLASKCHKYMSIRSEQALGGVKSGARKRSCCS